MIKQIIITALLALVVMAGRAQTNTELPADWQNVQYPQDETLPDAKINKGVATINVKLLGYKSDAADVLIYDHPTQAGSVIFER